MRENGGLDGVAAVETRDCVTGLGPSMKLRQHKDAPSLQFLRQGQKDFRHVAQSNRHEFIKGIGKRKGEHAQGRRVGLLRVVRNGASLLSFSFIGSPRKVSREFCQGLPFDF